MAKKRTNLLTDQLRQAIGNSGLTRYRIAKEAGISESALSQFYNGHRGLSMKALNALGECLELNIKSARAMEEQVKLPEALANQLGRMTVRYLGWEEHDRRNGECSKLLCEVIWGGRHYDCQLLLPAKCIVFDEKLAEDCRRLLCELTTHEAELEWRAGYLGKIEGVVEKAGVRLFKKLVKSKALPEGLRTQQVRHKKRT